MVMLITILAEVLAVAALVGLAHWLGFSGRGAAAGPAPETPRWLKIAGWALLAGVAGGAVFLLTRAGAFAWLTTPLPIDHLADPVAIAVPGFVLLVSAEVIWTARRGFTRRYATRDAAASLFTGLASTIIGALTAGVGLAAGFALWRWRLTTIPSTPLNLVAAFIAYDLAYYVSHRASHRIRWFWGNHVVHHSSQHYNLTTALRQPWFPTLTGHVIFTLPLVWLGFHPLAVGFVAALNLVYQFWIHTEMVGRMPGWFEAVFNTPSHHRVHHATNPKYLDANYAGVLIVWDRMLGSFVAEDPAEPPTYGLVSNITTHNPLRIATHEFAAIWRDQCQRLPWRARLAYLFAPPGFSHDGSRKTTAQIKAEAGLTK